MALGIENNNHEGTYDFSRVMRDRDSKEEDLEEVEKGNNKWRVEILTINLEEVIEGEETIIEEVEEVTKEQN